MRRIRLLVTGRVQRVGFRYYCQVEAVILGITGYARNASDGSVEIEAQGEDEALTIFESAVLRGPRVARVTEVRREERIAKPGETEFTLG